LLVGCWWAAAGWIWWRESRQAYQPLSPEGRGKKRAAARQRFWQLSACLAATCLATLVNPYGWEIYRYVGQTSRLAAARGIDEWLPPGFDQQIGVAFFVSLPVLAGWVWLGRQ